MTTTKVTALALGSGVLCIDHCFFFAPRTEEGEPLQHRVRLNFDFRPLAALGADDKAPFADYHGSLPSSLTFGAGQPL